MVSESKESRMRRRQKKSRRKLGLALHDARVLKGIDRDQMARNLNISNPTLCQWEHGDYMPSEKHWDAIFKNLGVSVADYKPDIDMETRPVTDFGPSAFAKKLHAIRMARKLTPHALNKMVLKTSSDAARAWERGEKLPTDESMKLLLEKLGDDEDTRELYALWKKEVNRWCKMRVLNWRSQRPRAERRPICKRKIINVSLKRCLDRNISSDGFNGDACLFLRMVARIIVGERINKTENRDRTEIPTWNKKTGSYTFVQQYKTYNVKHIWDFNWHAYLFNRHIAIKIVMNPEDEDKEFFGNPISKPETYKERTMAKYYHAVLRKQSTGLVDVVAENEAEAASKAKDLFYMGRVYMTQSDLSTEVREMEVSELHLYEKLCLDCKNLFNTWRVRVSHYEDAKSTGLEQDEFQVCLEMSEMRGIFNAIESFTGTKDFGARILTLFGSLIAKDGVTIDDANEILDMIDKEFSVLCADSTTDSEAKKESSESKEHANKKEDNCGIGHVCSQLLKAYRAEEGISQRKLGKILGVPGTRISKWECEVFTPSENSLRKIERTLGVNFKKGLAACLQDMNAKAKRKGKKRG